MLLPNQAKPVNRVITPELRRAVATGGVRPADFLDDLLKGLSVGTQIAGQLGQTVLPFLPFLL